MSSSPRKRKYVDVSEQSSSIVQPNKKFKSTHVQSVDLENNNNESKDTKKDETKSNEPDNKQTDSSSNNPTAPLSPQSVPIYKINDEVQLFREGNLHKATILSFKKRNGNILYFLHYHNLSSIHDEWVPKHKIEQIADKDNEKRDENPEDEEEDDDDVDLEPPNTSSDEDESEEEIETKPIYNQKLLDIIPEPAKNFNFELDPFQFNAIKSLELESVNLLITAHTSAGKTVIAEYAIAKALKHNQRVIYTSPIKALSNQKYREFAEKFGHCNIGLITGDVTKRKNASVLVMTTEILRNMLYRGGSELREVAYVIFDEVHYMRDIERGVVWEESIILLNSKIILIFLSATLSNSDDFAAWITNLKQKECKIIETDKRPIPLEHYVMAHSADSLYLVSRSDDKNKFIQNNFEYAQKLKEQKKKL